jgi:hypothetical protein
MTTTPVLFEPASAIAAGLCLAARTIAEGRSLRHPRPCGWCDYPVDGLRSMIDGFNAWAGWHEKRRTYERHDCRVFAELPARRQAELVLEAQAFPAAEPVAAVAAVPAHDADEEGPAWLRP